MFFLIFLLYTQNYVDVYQIGQYSSLATCEAERTKAMVLITNSKTRVLCFEVIPE